MAGGISAGWNIVRPLQGGGCGLAPLSKVIYERVFFFTILYYYSSVENRHITEILFFTPTMKINSQNESSLQSNSPPKHASTNVAITAGALHTMVNTTIAYFLDGGNYWQNVGAPKVNWIQYF
jgi:hypothetical protein